MIYHRNATRNKKSKAPSAPPVSVLHSPSLRFSLLPPNQGTFSHTLSYVSLSPNIPGPPPPKGSTVEQQKDIGLRAVKLPSAESIVVRTTLGFLAEIRRGLPGRNEAGSFWGEIGTKSLLGHFAYHDSQSVYWVDSPLGRGFF
ncbi:hypothetical protein C1H46_034683 [Malus baccata]|uniref:Uncharacterized protein n=1 Tax=Malus baccata TaxID=106549 RepID=A0A540L0A7_MALBA|nr:hypothetical protein C1H46_034683 [Malus baccata]